MFSDRCLSVLTCLCLCGMPLAVSLAADDLLPPDRPIHEVVDHYIDARLSEKGVTPAPAVSDAEFLRRVTLDLAGRIPTVHELRDYTAATDPAKKTALIDRLLASPDFAFHQRNRLDELLMGDQRKDGPWRDYLLRSVQNDKPWDQMFREMMVASEDDSELAPALTFLKVRLRDVNTLTNDVSRLFFGVSINCAQCHDHPLVDDWKQDHYFGFASFFNRTYQTKSNRLAEKFDGMLKFRDTEGVEKPAKFMFLTGVSVEEPPLELTDEQKKQNDEIVKTSMKEDKAPLPAPEFRPRERFVELALSESNRSYFTQSIVNRMWASLLGRGLVDPPDQNHSGNTPSHPELLQWLERDFVANGYNLKRLLGGIAASNAYTRSSAWEGERPNPELFAVGSVRVLSPRQYSLSLLIATAGPESLPASIAEERWSELRKNWDGAAEGFADRLERPTEHFQVSVDEALMFSNDTRVDRDYLRDSGDKLVGAAQSLEDPSAQLELLFESALSRRPTDDERSIFLGYLQERSDRAVDGLKQVLWALITSPEMRFNY